MKKNKKINIAVPLPLDFNSPENQESREVNNFLPSNKKPKIKSKEDIKKRKNNPKFDSRNKLNDLNGAEWQFSTKSVISKIYPTNLQHKLRSQHGGQKPPDLCADLIKVFTKKGQVVLDPLAGVGGTLLGAARVEREAIGIELNEKWINVYNQVCNLENLKRFPVLLGDANILLKEIKTESIDFILTDVPYWIMDQVKKTRSTKASRNSNLSKFNDKSLQTKSEWLLEMKQIFTNSLPVLKNNAYMAVFIGDMYRGKEFHFLSAELAKTISDINGFLLKSDIIWHDDSKMLHIYGYPFAYIPSMIHQHILVFRKELK